MYMYIYMYIYMICVFIYIYVYVCMCILRHATMTTGGSRSEAAGPVELDASHVADTTPDGSRRSWRAINSM